MGGTAASASREVIATARLLLVPPRPEHASRIEALIGERRVAMMLSRVPHPYPPGAARAFIKAMARAARAGADHAFSILLAEDADAGPIGVVGLHRRTAGSSELGYWIGVPFWGRGLMTEAAGAAVAFGFGTLALERLTSGHFVDNPASGRVLEKLGFRRLGAATRPCLARGRVALASVEYALDRADWCARRRRPA